MPPKKNKKTAKKGAAKVKQSKGININVQVNSNNKKRAAAPTGPKKIPINMTPQVVYRQAPVEPKPNTAENELILKRAQEESKRAEENRKVQEDLKAQQERQIVVLAKDLREHQDNVNTTLENQMENQHQLATQLDNQVALHNENVKQQVGNAYVHLHYHKNVSEPKVTHPSSQSKQSISISPANSSYNYGTQLSEVGDDTKSLNVQSLNELNNIHQTPASKGLGSIQTKKSKDDASSSADYNISQKHLYSNPSVSDKSTSKHKIIPQYEPSVHSKAASVAPSENYDDPVVNRARQEKYEQHKQAENKSKFYDAASVNNLKNHTRVQLINNYYDAFGEYPKISIKDKDLKGLTTKRNNIKKTKGI
jgi:hypothetical protein